MDYENKYKEALKRAEAYYDKGGEDMRILLGTIFPELREKEDARIWQALLDYYGEGKNMDSSISDDSVVDWLERHRSEALNIDVSRTAVPINEHEQAPSLEESPKDYNSIDPYFGKVIEHEEKFGDDDWVVCEHNNIVGAPIQYKDTKTVLCQTMLSNLALAGIKPNIRRWTIRDARDGDVLATLDYILIFKRLLNYNGGESYCHYDFGALNPQFIFSEDKNWYFGREAKISPATKEQHDTLFAKMKESGYEWDAEKKLLIVVR